MSEQSEREAYYEERRQEAYYCEQQAEQTAYEAGRQSVLAQVRALADDYSARAERVSASAENLNGHEQSEAEGSARTLQNIVAELRSLSHD